MLLLIARVRSLVFVYVFGIKLYPNNNGEPEETAYAWNNAYAENFLGKKDEVLW